jgi:6-phosphogluconolactonase
MIDARSPSPEPGPAGGIYAFEAEPVPAPVLPGATVVTAPTGDELIDMLAADLTIHAENCVREFGDFHLALSGGTTPLPLYRRLMVDPNYRRLPWRRTQLWIVDERAVGLEHERSNYRAIGEFIVDHADIPREQVHPILACGADADVDYEAELRESLAWREKGQDRLDYVLLGMGADGHVASLFPGTEPLHEPHRLVRTNVVPDDATPRRVTMTLPLINAARFIAVLVTGGEKAEAIRRLAAGGETLDTLPVTGLRPLNGVLRWYLDEAACGG